MLQQKYYNHFGATLNIIEIWNKLFNENYDDRRVAYINDMKEMFEKMPTTMTKPLSSRQKFQKLMKEIGVGCIWKK